MWRKEQDTVYAECADALEEYEETETVVGKEYQGKGEEKLCFSFLSVFLVFVFFADYLEASSLLLQIMTIVVRKLISTSRIFTGVKDK